MATQTNRRWIRLICAYVAGVLTVVLLGYLGLGRGRFVVLLIVLTVGGVVAMTGIALWKGISGSRSRAP